MLFLLPAFLIADTYRYTDPATGAVVFTDQPPANQNAQKIQLNEPAVVSPFSPTEAETAPGQPQDQEPDNTPAATPGIRILAPESEATVRNIGGLLQVVAALSNAGELKEFFIRYKLDGQVVEESTQLAVTLNNVYRGSHQLVAELVSLRGDLIAASEPVNFYVHQASIR